MSEAAITTYDPKKVNITIAGRLLGGYAEGVVSVASNEDIVNPTHGVQGDVAYAENANESAIATIPLLSTSASLAYIRQMCKARKQFTFLVSDANDDDSVHISAEHCRINKMPDLPRNKEVVTVNVTVFIPHLEYR